MSEVKRPCPDCGAAAKLVGGDVVYPHRPDLFAKRFWACMPCDCYVGCHPGTDRRMGRLANATTRALKQAAHRAFDPLWQSGDMKRGEAYAWLQKATGLSKRDCHIGWMTDEQLRAVPELVEARGQGGGNG